ncbi:MAG: DUF4105 domain-containing protein [Candidatus Competibacteraceae bacterium]|nr:DUF4105 domain-containing protein [Candidatus Competibacteraceae bacterium]
MAGADDTRHSYLAELLQRSELTELAQRREWHVLLHYRPARNSTTLSEIDDPRFFLAADGKTNPPAELAATLRSFFSTEPLGDSEQPARCAFPARYHWLKSVLALDEQQLPAVRCTQLTDWIKALDPASATLIFASAYMNNPASMFGHTLLRIDQRGRTDHLLAYTINYAAHDTSTGPLDYVVSGIGGGFKGYLDIKPYYELVKEYGDFENRDLWEYRLNLTMEQVHRLLLHVWELQDIYSDYYFFKENCSYRLLALLEVANPELRLTDTFIGWAIPPDTVRLLTAQPGLISDVTARPARSTHIRRQLQNLTQQERPLLPALIHDPGVTSEPAFVRLSDQRQAFLLDTAINYLQYRIAKEEHEEDEEDGEENGEYEDQDAGKQHQQLHQLLTARSRLIIASEPSQVVPFAKQPELGHGSFRMGFGFGWRDTEPFQEISARAAYHDLLDPEPGYTPDAQIEALDVALRYYPQRNRVVLDKLTLVDIVSLTPLNSLLFSPSWKVRAGLDAFAGEDCRDCLIFNLNGGIGLAWQSNVLHREVYFFLPELDVNYGQVFTDDYRAGPGMTVGVLASVTDRWKILASARYLHYPWGDTGTEKRLRLSQSYTLSKDWLLRFEFAREAGENTALLSVFKYF